MPAKSRPRKSVTRSVRKAATLPKAEASLKRTFQHRLIKWYKENGRDLPWRKTSDPYHILVSEVMLQQTQVDRVIPKYQEFLDRYPSFEDLASAPVEDVRKTWYPLGYNIRPERLHSIACETVVRYGGSSAEGGRTIIVVQGNRAVYRGGHSLVRIQGGRAHSGYERHAGSSSRLYRQRRLQEPQNSPLETRRRSHSTRQML